METVTALPPGRETGPLAEELKTYLAHQAELLQTAKGKYALIEGSTIVGLFDRQDDALSEAYQRFRHSRFMIKQVQEHDEVVTIDGPWFVFFDD